MDFEEGVAVLRGVPRNIGVEFGFKAYDDGEDEPPETFSVVLLDPLSGEVLWGEPGFPAPGSALKLVGADGEPLKLDDDPATSQTILTICDVPRAGRKIAQGEACFVLR